MEDKYIVNRINLCVQKMLDYGVEALNDEELTAAVISELDFEILNGGMYGYMLNTAGDNVVKSADALQRIEAYDAECAIRNVIGIFPDESMLFDRNYRQDYILRNSCDFSSMEEKYESQSPSVWEKLIEFFKKDKI